MPTSDGGGYPVRIGPGVLQELPELLERLVGAHRYALISDESVMELHGSRAEDLLVQAGLEVARLAFPGKEQSKTREVWADLTDRLVDAGLGRDGCVIALGGGVTGDLAGFVAATYMRGIPLVQVPTSIVAMVDSAVGGKTGVDVPGGKNLVGAFHPPRLVLVDTELARTLPREERSRGLAEAVKHGAILDRVYLQEIQEGARDLLDGEPEATARVVARSVELKAQVVGQDELEGGVRRILNFGHTLGHALEAATGYRVPHGEAVAIGMVLEATLGEEVEVTESGTARALSGVLECLELPVSLPQGLDARTVLEWTRRDKKVREGRVGYVLLRRIGEVDPGTGWTHPVADEQVVGVLDGEPANPSGAPSGKAV